MKTRPTLYDQTGQPFSLGPQLGRGGEGAVFELPADSRFVAKLYHRPPDATKSEKLKCMARLSNPDLLKVAAWPVGTLHAQPSGPLVGLLMPRIEGYKEVHTLYSPAHRNEHFPTADWTFLIRTALNCAFTFDVLHRQGHVLGDVNQSNVLVSGKATTVLIDCDSYQIATPHRSFPCEVGVPLYTPPELQGQNFRKVLRTQNHDAFGLAVLIFHLLFMGRHPFSGRFLGKGDLPLERAIKDCRFAFGASAATLQMAPPPYSLPLATVTSEVSNLFERSFGPGAVQPNGRPTAAEWRDALLNLEKQLRRCRSDPAHRFSAHLRDCPWCIVMRQGGPDFFLSLSIHLGSGAQRVVVFRFTEIKAQLERILSPGRCFARPVPPMNAGVQPNPLPKAAIVPPLVPFKRSSGQKTVGWIVLASALLIPILPIYGVPQFVVFVVWWGVWEVLARNENRRENSSRDVARVHLDRERKRRDELRTEAQAECSASESRLQDVLQKYDTEFERCKLEAESMCDEYFQLESRFVAERRELERSRERAQLNHFLRKFLIEDHKIAAIGPSRVAQLCAYGIQTAADISASAIDQIPGFGPALVNKLQSWRLDIERRFRFDPQTGVPQTEIAALNQRQTTIRRDLETRITKNMGALKTLSAKCRQHADQMAQQLQEQLNRLAQAEADYQLANKQVLYIL